MKMTQVKKKEASQGSASMIMVMALAVTILVSFGAIHVYLENRGKYQGQLKSAYKFTFVTEDLAKMVNTAIVTYGQTGGVCPPGTTRGLLRLRENVSNLRDAVLGCFQTGAGGGPQACVKNSEDVNQNFCVEQIEANTAALGMGMGMGMGMMGMGMGN